MDVKWYRLEELESHLRSTLSRPSGTQPLSPLRLASYLNNPRAKPSDVVLIEMRQQGKLLAYRTLLPDQLRSGQGQWVRFAWLSGNWVHPDFRREGHSTRLLQSAEKAWEGRLMYTNYAPASKAVYDRSARFREVALRQGKRFYLRAASAELMAKRLKGSRYLAGFDGLINKFREGKLERFQSDRSGGYSVEKMDGWDDTLRPLIAQVQENSLFQRGTEHFTWALNHPWITDQEALTLDYHFSYQAQNFENRVLKFRLSDSGSAGMLWLMIHNQAVSVPYVFARDEALYTHMAEYILQTMIASGSTHATLRNQELIRGLMHYRRFFLLIRNMPQRIFAHQKLADHIPENKSIQDGDGDVMFTG